MNETTFSPRRGVTSALIPEFRCYSGDRADLFKIRTAVTVTPEALALCPHCYSFKAIDDLRGLEAEAIVAVVAGGTKWIILKDAALTNSGVIYGNRDSIPSCLASKETSAARILRTYQAWQGIKLFSSVREEQTDFAEFIASLETVNNAEVLQHWLKKVCDSGLVPEEGLLPDDIALQIIQRLLDVSFSKAYKHIEGLLLHPPHFRAPLFQLSILGALTRHMSEKSDHHSVRAWIKDLVEKLMIDQTYSEKARASILGAGLTCYFFVEDATVEGALRFQGLVERGAKSVGRSAKLLVQFLADSLGNFANGELKHHYLKFAMLAIYLTEHQPAWPDTPFLCKLRETFVDPIARLCAVPRDCK